MQPLIAFEGRRAALGTMHGKERVIAPELRSGLGLEVEVTRRLDTDRFGTFTREIRREKSPFETARAKVRAALDEHRDAAVGIASEGSFGPHPTVPFLPGGVEWVVLYDAEHDLELVGTDVTLETNYGGREVASREDALRFAQAASFPSHALVVAPARDAAPDAIVKGIKEPAALDAVVAALLRARGRLWIETDMRAHMNPTRMRSIARATRELVAAARSRCPRCARPGFVVRERVAGLPCGDCGRPTARVRAEVRTCAGCGVREESARDGGNASPADCEECNP